MADIILIEGLKVETVIGCFAWERRIQQPLLLDLKIYTDLSTAGKSDELTDTLNYAEICQHANDIICQHQPKLIEHAAQLVIDDLFQHFVAIEKINIIIRKPAILPQAQSVAIQIERCRQ